MHRALLRRTVEQAAMPFLNMQAPGFELAWHVVDSSEGTEQMFIEGLRRPGILIVDCDTLVRRVEHSAINAPVIQSLYERSNDQIRLLWHWSNRGKEDLVWCTEKTFDGVIFDLSSLSQWVRVCLKRGKVIEGQRNILLRDLQLPRIALQDSLPV